MDTTAARAQHEFYSGHTTAKPADTGDDCAPTCLWCDQRVSYSTPSTGWYHSRTGASACA